MKYIRTKDNVWQYDRNENVVRPSEDGKSIVYWLNFGEKEIIAKADTIEELCDEFVYRKNLYKLETRVDGTRYIDRYHFGGYDNHMTYDLDKSNIKCLNDLIPEIRKEVYGAIWTDKGLIYVAKMNDKGEWELL